MTLFQRIIRNILPSQLVRNEMSPSTLFLSFISPKQFFTVISRKILENNSSNLFDIGLDSLESAVGREEYGLKMKEVEPYYSYLCAANINGQTLYSPSNIGVTLTVISAKKLHPIFEKFDWKIGYYFLMTVYLLSYIFSHRIKIFPYNKTEKEKNFNWFIKLFFSLFTIAAKQNNEELTNKTIEHIKNQLLSEIEVFFMLFWVYQKEANIFTSTISNVGLYNWMLSEHHNQYKVLNKDIDTKGLTEEFIKHHLSYTKVAQFSKLDEILLQKVLPQDILIKYIYHTENLPIILRKTISPIYKDEVLDPYLRSFLTDDAQIDKFFSVILKFDHYKETFFEGMKDTVRHIYRTTTNYKQEKAVDEFLSRIEDTGGDISPNDVPDILRNESQLTEKLLNFYVSFIGGIFVNRGDGGLARLQGLPVCTIVQNSVQNPTYNKRVLQHYGKYLLMYSKNKKQYEEAQYNISNKKKNKKITKQLSNHHITNNISIIHAAQEMMSHTLFGDHINKQLQLIIDKKSIINNFKEIYSQNIQNLIKLNNTEFLNNYYMNLFLWLNMEGDENLVYIKYHTPFVPEIKETLYTIHTHVYQDVIRLCNKSVLTELDPRIKLSLAYTIKETIIGYFLWMYSIPNISKDEEAAKSILQNLKYIYIQDILGLQGNKEINAMQSILESIENKIKDIAQEWVSLDDNQSFFNVMRNNVYQKHIKKESETIMKLNTSELLWYKNCLQNINYYNHRSLKGIQ